jgi:hypothetical protein
VGIARRLRGGIGGAWTRGSVESTVVASEPQTRSLITHPQSARSRDVAWVAFTYGPIDPEFAEIYRSAITREVRPRPQPQPMLRAGVQPADVVPEPSMRLGIIVQPQHRRADWQPVAPMLGASVLAPDLLSKQLAIFARQWTQHRIHYSALLSSGVLEETPVQAFTAVVVQPQLRRWQQPGLYTRSLYRIVDAYQGRVRFTAHREQIVFPVRQIMTDEDEYTFDPVTKDPAGARKVVLDLFSICANFWRPNEEYSEGEFIRPNRANGFSCECTTAGTAGAREPTWPTTVGSTVTSGSATFTCRAASTNGLSAITSPSASSDLTVSDVSVEESTKILATYAVGGTDGEDYDVVFSFTLDGVTRIARQTVRVRKQ